VLHHLFSAELLAALAGLWSVLSTLAVFRVKRWAERHLARERQLEMQRHNETLKILSQASAPVERPTLDSLLGDEKLDFRLESSPTSYDPQDWSDDDQETETLPGTPEAKRLQQSELIRARLTPKPTRRS
jgi:hypothetical protein